MANIRSAIKRNRQNEKRRLHNRVSRGSTRTQIRKARLAIVNGENEAAEEVKQAVIKLDRAAAKGIIHKNNAARRKSRLMRQLTSLEK